MATWNMPSTRLKWVALAGLALLVLALVVALADRLAERRAVDGEKERLSSIAKLTASGYLRQVDKFRLVATTLSADPDVATLLNKGSGQAGARLNQRLASLTATLDASVIYLIDDDGTTIASSNWRQADSFVGENYGFRAYFIEAMARGEWEQYALGTRSRIPGLFVARRVVTAESKRGVIVVKIRFDRLEQEWASTLGTAFVASEQGVILITSKPAMRFETIRTLDEAARQRLTAQVEYGNASLRQNALFAEGAVIRSGTHYDRKARFVEAVEALPDGRSVRLLAPIAEAVASARWFARLAAALAFAMIAGLVAAFVLRARALVAREQRENEVRVAELKDRLVQANKLSTLGQIAAGVGHEINQPLTAIGIRAQAARKLVNKGRIDEAGAVLDDITALIARAGAITGELRRFARRARSKADTVALSDVIEGTRLLLGDRLRSSGTRLEVEGPDLRLKADQGRLEQVFVNLIQNALDAMGEGGEIRISVAPAGETATIEISDIGPGIPEAVRERLFQPFTSSKEDGLGLGLVICRDIITELGGDLVFVPGEGGACFAVTLKVVP